jgi:hypothetical protein
MNTVRDAPSGLITLNDKTGGLRHRLISVSPFGLQSYTYRSALQRRQLKRHLIDLR